VLWLTQLWFPFQFVLVIVILLPLSVLGAWLLERGIDAGARGLGRARSQKHEP
jgi:peptidoglycan/LPS O-acetylase OafA/YrhL